MIFLWAGCDMFKCGETHSHAEQSRAVVVLNPETVFGQIFPPIFGEIFLPFLLDSSYSLAILHSTDCGRQQSET